MKRTLLLIFAAFLAISVSGQVPDLKTRMSAPKKTNSAGDRGFLSLKTDHGKPFDHRSIHWQKSQLKQAILFLQKLDSVYVEKFDSATDQLELDEKYEFTYTASGSLASETAYRWSRDTEQWVPDWRDEYSYDAAGNLTEIILFGWNSGTDDWVFSDREEYVYEAGNLFQIIYSQWLEDEQDWYLLWLEEFTYDASGNMIQEVFHNYNHDAEEWDAEWKLELTYDNGNITEEISYNWDLTGEVWVEETRYVNEYDGEGNPLQTTLYEWENDEWQETLMFEYERDAEGRITRLVYSDFETGEWEQFFRIEYSYDTNSNVTEEISSFFEDGDWVLFDKNEFTVDESYLSEEVLTPYGFGFVFAFTNMLTGLEYYLHDGSDWNIDSRSTLYYSEFTDIDPDNFTLIINIAGNGSVTVDGEPYTEAISVESNTELTLEAIADEGWLFIGWTGDLISSNPAETITMDRNKEIDAVFVEVLEGQYTLIINIDGEGTVNVNGEPYTEPVIIDEDTEVALEAIPDEGYEFTEWSGDLESVNPSETITMDDNKSITVTFSIVNTAVVPESAGFEVFPNPFSSSITIKNIESVSTLTFVNLIGRTVKEVNLTQLGTTTIPTEELENGVYFLIFRTSNGERTVLKMIKN
jgi:hypothetical protein